MDQDQLLQTLLVQLFLPLSYGQMMFIHQLTLFISYRKLCSIFFSSLHCVVMFQVAIEVEREEDEGGMVGETFMDYVCFLCNLSFLLLVL